MYLGYNRSMLAKQGSRSHSNKESLIPFLTRYKEHIPLLIALLVTAPIVFFQAFRYSLPLGYAGMFALVAEKIADANFALPMSIPHYGPGGVPLVYPPFAMYVFALAIKVGFPTWAYLRLAPALFTLLSAIPLYYFTLALLRSKVAGVLAVVLIMTTPATYYTNVWSAGVVRALALFLCLSGLFFYIRALREFSWRMFLLAGLSLGLLFTTHLLYVVFAALVGLACLLSEWSPSRVRTAFGILLVALLVASPWLIVVLGRHGMESMLIAYSSHNNVDFISSLKDVSLAVQFIGDNLRQSTENWFIAALAIPGLVLLVYRRKFHIPLAFLFILLLGEIFFYAKVLTGMMAAAFCAEVFQWTSTLIERNGKRVLKLVPAVLVALCVVLSSINGLAQIAQYQPEINHDSLEMASFVRANTDPDATYLFVGRINEAEWFPYLLDRTPVFALWGSEWMGTYDQQLEILIALRECQLRKDWACMQEIQQNESVSPSLLVTPNSRWLTLQLKDTHTWDRIYMDETYVVWQRIN
jgi:hypothetical protein